MDFQDIEYRVNEPVATITLSRPDQLNSFTRHTLSEIRKAINAAVADRQVVGLVITGNGRAFSAGLDMTTLAEVTGTSDSKAASNESQSNQLPGIFSYFLEVPKPIIAAVNGVAAGGGLILAMMSDLRFASTEASVTTVFLKRGLIAEHGSSWLLPRMVGVSKALDLLWMSDKIGAEEAKEIGLIDRLCEPDQLLAEATAYIEKLAVTSAPKAIAASKHLVYRHLGMEYTDALREADGVQGDFVGAPDSIEGAKSFIERRPPQFQRLGDD
ncbi:MAG: enoyl-CoA hydratase [Gammaproteobacteria bacterium]|uniref:Enoyl-CoA hydratase n=1 Tax=OM182 bacterium MED-G24 TaxID=1986255 RepID=A0A2A5WWQ9_9GAMM|nr:enoyl-CoA hydratase [Gammaproteobacteria bacterium]PDH40713.1 MAG: enoyl-CoA hydratase [OM182 bacterium MED-G24]RPG26569.1 MAG: enoyl-CoA hydratase [Gammaproteobacteria bacterium TMED50]